LTKMLYQSILDNNKSNITLLRLKIRNYSGRKRVKKGLLRVLGVVVTLALMLVAFPASVASAAATVTNLVVMNIEGNASTNPYYGDAEGLKTDHIALTLTGTTEKYYSLYFSSQKANKADDIGDEVKTYKEWESIFYTQPSTSSHVSTLSLPSSLLDGPVDEAKIHGGVYYFYVTEYFPSTTTTAARSDTKILYVAEYYIHGLADVAVDGNQGKVGDQVEVEGTGFAPNEYVILKYDNVEINDYIVSGDSQVDTDGNFSFIFAIPPSVKGAHTIKVIGENSRIEENFTFTVSPSVTLSVTSGAAGTVITVYGEGFARSKYVDVYFGNTKIDDNNAAVRTDRTNSAGSITYVMTIPVAAPAGSYAISIKDETTDSITASANFTVTLNSLLALSTNTGNVGDTVTVTGSNFTPSSNITVMFDATPRGTFTVDASGNFTADIQIPAAACGAHKIKVGAVEQTYTITPKMTLDKIQGIAGTTVTITGTGFASSTAIAATFNAAAIAISPAITDANGGFVSSFIVPSIATGAYNIQVTAGSSQTASFTIVEPTLAISTATGKVGDTITVTGTNFGASKTITLTVDDVAVITTPSSITSAANGGFTATFNIPTIAGGVHTLAVSDGTASKSAQFTVTADADISPTSGNVGQAVTVSGDGFIAGATLTIKYDGVAVATGTLPSTGAFTNATFTVPASIGGSHNIDITDGTNTIQKTFTMETTPPTKPTLTLPLSASKEKGIVTFDWNDSTDASMPVTYTLVIATDSAFTNLAFTKAGLTASTYTLTEAEKLPKLAGGGSYYWRVVAKDAANNSVNSDVSTFVVGGGMPGWLMWVWIGIGVVVVFVFAVWLGRRLAYSSY
jgi:hypothetical protein